MIDNIVLFPYYLTLKLRHLFYDKGWRRSAKADVPTICVGNVTVGGTGKTPHTEMILRMLCGSEEWGGKNIAMLSRGYKRKSRGFQQVTLDGTARLYGDEPLQIKKNVPGVTVAVDKDRIEGCAFLAHPDGLNCLKKGRQCLHPDFPAADLIVLDDAFQFRALRPDVSIVLVDWNRPVHKDMLLPLGGLRDLPQRLEAADVIVVTKCLHYMEDEEKADFARRMGLRDYDPATCSAMSRKGRPQKLFFTCIDHMPMVPVYPEGDAHYVYAKKLVLFSGIAKDTALRNFLSDKYKIVKRFVFKDHHRYSRADIRSISRASQANPTAVLATTQKDAQRVLDCEKVPENVRDRLFQVPIEVSFLSDEDRAIFASTLMELLRRS